MHLTLVFSTLRNLQISKYNTSFALHTYFHSLYKWGLPYHSSKQICMWEKGRGELGSVYIFLFPFTLNLVSNMLQWWPTGRITAGRKRYFHTNKRAGAEIEAEASIILITNLDLSDVLKIRMCSMLLLGDEFLDCNRQWKVSGIAREKLILQAQKHGWASPAFLVSDRRKK